MHNYRKNNTSLSIRNRHNQSSPQRYIGPVSFNEMHIDPKGDPRVLNQACAPMPEALSPDVVVYLCTNCIPQGGICRGSGTRTVPGSSCAKSPAAARWMGSICCTRWRAAPGAFAWWRAPRATATWRRATTGPRSASARSSDCWRKSDLQPERAQLVHFSPAIRPRNWNSSSAARSSASVPWAKARFARAR